MDRAYWDEVAEDYAGRVLSVFEHDTGRLIEQRIRAAANPTARAADLGCGVGKFTPLLAEAFGHVEACDLSPACLAAAAAACARHDNVAFHELDLVSQPAPFEPVAFALCINVLLMPSLDECLRAWRCVVNQVDHGGTLLLVAPAHEAMLYHRFQLVQAALDAGASGPEAERQADPGPGTPHDLPRGVWELEGLRTKHYLREELCVLLDEACFEVEECLKLPYGGAEGRPAWWDWLVQARRR